MLRCENGGKPWGGKRTDLMAMPSLLKQRKCFACTISSQAQTTAPSHHQQPNTLDNAQPLSPSKTQGNTQIQSPDEHPGQRQTTITTPLTTPRYHHQPNTLSNTQPPSQRHRQHQHIITSLDNTQPLSSVENPRQHPDTITSRTPLTTPRYHHQPNTLDNTQPPSPAKHP